MYLPPAMKRSYYHVLIGIVLSIFFISCGKIEEPKFRRLGNFGVRKVDFQQATIGVDVIYYNSNNFGVGVKEAAFDLYVDTFYLGRFTQPQQVDVNSSSEFSIPLEGKISWQQAMNPYLRQLAGKEALVKANGSVKVGKAGVFVTRNVNYEGKHKLDLDLIKNPAGAGLK